MKSDSQRLLIQIQRMLGAAAVTVGSQGCDAPAAGTSEAATTKQVAAQLKFNRSGLAGVTSKATRTGAAQVDAGGKAAATLAASSKPRQGVTVKNTLPPPPIPGYQLGDPPLVEGWNPEEATCVSGNWCGPAAAAAKVVRVGMEDELDPETKCPTHLMGKKEGGVDKKLKVYRGLSADRMMRGTFQPWRTAQTRAQRGKEELCCYHWFDYCAGRPLDQGERTSEGRVEIAAQRQAQVCDAEALALAQAYWADADDEYDSVAAFARCTLDLFALGAPAALIEASQRASLDELKHARQCQALSRHYYAHDLRPREPMSVQSGVPDLAAFLLETFRHGCVGEAVASLRVSRMAAKSKDPKVKALLLEIAQDEAAHAALAWKILGWGMELAGDAFKGELDAEADRLEAELMSAPESGDVFLANTERLTPQELRACARDAWQGVVRPMLRA